MLPTIVADKDLSLVIEEKDYLFNIENLWIQSEIAFA